MLDPQHRDQPETTPKRFSLRTQRPVFDGQSVGLQADPQGDVVNLWTVGADGCVGMHVTVVLG